MLNLEKEIQSIVLKQSAQNNSLGDIYNAYLQRTDLWKKHGVLKSASTRPSHCDARFGEEAP